MTDHLTELHLHLDGSLRPETVWELINEQELDIQVKGIAQTATLLKAPADCHSLNEYLKCFDLPAMVLQRADAIERVTFELIEDLADEGITLAEIRFAPQLSTTLGLSQEEAVEAAVRGARRAMSEYPQCRAGLILCCMRGDHNEEQNFMTIETAREFLGDVVRAVDLAGAEALYPTRMFAPVFARAREYNIPMTIHAGEAAGPESIREALSFGTRRIGHGVAAASDPELMKELADEGIVLEVCPTSNLQTHVCERMEEHPIRRLFDAGVKVTVNSDNRTVSDTTLRHEIDLLKACCGFTDEEIDLMQSYAAEASFLLNL